MKQSAEGEAVEVIAVVVMVVELFARAKGREGDQWKMRGEAGAKATTIYSNPNPIPRRYHQHQHQD